MQNKVKILHKQSLKALIVEDSDDDAELLVHQLIRGGYDLQFERVQTMEEMQHALAAQSWDIVISDYQLPKFSAPAALACVRQNALDLPFIVVSGVIDEETSVNILSAGAHDFILKGRWSRLIPAIQREVREAKERHTRFAAEKSARIAAEQYRVIFETIGTPILIVDKKMRVLLANTPVLQLVGVTEKELIGNRSWMNLIDPADLRRIINLYSTQINTNVVDRTHYEAKIFDKRGGDHVVVGTIAIVPGTDTGIISLLDVTERKRAEEALRKSEALNRAVIDHSPLGISVRNKYGEHLQSNPVWQQTWGSSDSGSMQKPGDNYWDTLFSLTPSILQRRTEFGKVLDQGGELYIPELELTNVYHHTVDWVSLYIYTTLDNNNQVDRVVLLTQDISHRKSTENALRQSEELFSTAFRSSPDGMTISQFEDGRLIEVNETWEELFGYHRAEAVGLTPHQLNMYRSYDDHNTLLDFVYKNGSVHNYEIVMVRKNGQNILISLSVEPITINQSACLLFTYQDITETRRTEQALRESEDLYRALFENNHSAFVLFNPATFAIVDANQAACDYYGYDRDHLRSMKVTQLTVREPEDLASLFIKIKENKETRYESKHRLASGEIREVEEFSGPLQRGGQELIISVVHDITERKLADIALRRRADELAALHAIAVVGAEAYDEDILITRATQIINQTLFSDMVGVLLLDPTRQFLTPHPSYYGISEEAKNNKIALHGSVSGKVVTTGLPISIEDVSQEPEYFEASPATRSELCVPLKISGRIIGAINLESIKLDAYHEADQHLLITIAGQLATAIERLRTEAAEREQAKQLSTIFEIGQEIVSARLESDQVYIAIHKAVNRLMTCEAFVIVRLDQTHNDLAAVYAWDRGGRASPSHLPLEAGISGYVIKHGKSILCKDSTEAESLTKMVYFGDPVHTESCLAVPLRIGEHTIGSLSVQSYTPGMYSYVHLHLLELFASYAAIALDNTRLFDETRQQALTFENLFDAVIKTNSRGMITGWNNAAEQLFGYSKDETIGMSLHHLFIFQIDEYTQFINQVFDILKQQSRWSGEVAFRKKNHGQGTAEIVILAVWDESKELAVGIFVFREITP